MPPVNKTALEVAQEDRELFERMIDVAVSPVSDDEKMNFIVRGIGMNVGADRCYVYYFQAPGVSPRCDNVYEWCAEGVKPEIEGQQNCDMSGLPDFYDAIVHGRVFSFNDITKISAGSRDWLASQGIQSLIAMPFRRTDGEIEGFVGFDFVSNRVKSFNDRIARNILEAANMITLCRRLAKEREAANAANAAKSYFFSSVSHDIRTPLNAIIGFSELLRLGIEDEGERIRALDSITSSGKMLMELINDVLDLSKLESGKMEIRPEPSDVSALISEVLTTFSASASQKGLLLANDIGSMPKYLVVDPHRIRQILFNLIGNAVKFTDSGEVKVKARWNNDILQLDVSDTGCGIPSSHRDLLMTPYTRLVNGSGKSGTGLGLAICRQLAVRMGGELSFESQLNQGSTFLVKIPANESSVTITRKEDPLPVAKPQNHFSKVLVVDDSKVNLAVMKAMLSRRPGLGIVLAGDGEEALSILKREHDIDLVLTDMWMPIMDGVGLVNAIRADSELCHLPVYAVTADVESQNGGEKMTGFSGVILKPFTLAKLEAILG